MATHDKPRGRGGPDKAPTARVSRDADLPTGRPTEPAAGGERRTNPRIEDEDSPRPGVGRRVLITGAGGTIGGVLRARLGHRYDLLALTRAPAPFATHVGDVSDLASIEPAFRGVDAVVHLAGDASVDASWDSVLRSNIIGTYNVFEAARRAGVQRVVLASSNHVIGMYEVDGAPWIYELDDPRTYGTEVSVRPDSLYGASKCFGEAVGRLYSDRYGLEVVCLRIGWVVASDDPADIRPGQLFSPLPELNSEQVRKRARAVWLSHRDCAQLVSRALEAQVRWAVAYGTSANPRQMWDLEPARRLLGFEPEDAAPV
jgi:nucleoside-diphosphate-sugar epimerase